jgi:hypothetical protein
MGQVGFNLTALNQQLDQGNLNDVKLDPALIERTQNNLPQIIEATRGLF